MSAHLHSCELSLQVRAAAPPSRILTPLCQPPVLLPSGLHGSSSKMQIQTVCTLMHLSCCLLLSITSHPFQLYSPTLFSCILAQPAAPSPGTRPQALSLFCSDFLTRALNAIIRTVCSSCTLTPATPVSAQWLGPHEN